jgi:putative addiction module component (TIGR02574 family)
MSFDDIKRQALKLSPEERETLAQELSDSLGEEPIGTDFKAELDRRWQEIESGKVKTIPHDKVMAHARESLKKLREETTLSSKSGK